MFASWLATAQVQISYLILGIDWVTSNHIKPAVANISIATSGISNALDSAIQNSINAGITYVIAAGNANMDACNFSPSRAPAAITVGALRIRISVQVIPIGEVALMSGLRDPELLRLLI